MCNSLGVSRHPLVVAMKVRCFTEVTWFCVCNRGSRGSVRAATSWPARAEASELPISERLGSSSSNPTLSFRHSSIVICPWKHYTSCSDALPKVWLRNYLRLDANTRGRHSRPVTVSAMDRAVQHPLRGAF